GTQHVAYGRKTPAMDFARSEAGKRIKMRRSAITHMPFESVSGMGNGCIDHHPVACDLGGDGGGCDGKRACIAAHNGERGAGKRLRLAVSINEGKLRCARQGGNRAFHRKEGRLQYVAPVDLLDGCDPDPYLGAGLKCGKELLPAWGVEFL